jgi:hypothetical protein
MGRLWALLEPILLVAFGLDLLLLLHDGSSFGSRRNRAVFERELVRARTDDGRKRAKAPWRDIWPSAEADRATTKGSHPATRGRAVGRFGPVPRREPSHH